MPLYKSFLPLNLQFFADPDPTDPSNPQDPPKDPEPKVYDEEYVEKLRKENAKYRTKAKDLETTSQTAQQDLMKKVFETFGINPDPNLEFEKQLSLARQQAQEAEQRANDKLIRAEIKSIGAELGVVDPDVAYLLVGKDSLSVKEDGTVEGVKEALEKVITEKPYLVNAAPGEPPRQSGYQPGSQQKGNDPKKKDAYEVGKEQFERLKKAGKIKL